MFRIYDGRETFYQWDLNQKLIVDDVTVNEVHFCTRACSEALVVEVYEFNGLRVANVPNILLQKDFDLLAYAYCESEFTKHCETYKIIARCKPTDYVYSETEVKRFEVLESGLAQAQEDIKAIKPANAFIYHDTKEVKLQSTISTQNRTGGALGLILNKSYLIETYNSNGELLESYTFDTTKDNLYNSHAVYIYGSVQLEDGNYIEYCIYDGVRNITRTPFYGEYYVVENLTGNPEGLGELTLKITGDFLSYQEKKYSHIENTISRNSPYPVTSDAIYKELSGIRSSVTPTIVKREDAFTFDTTLARNAVRAEHYLSGYITSGYPNIAFNPIPLNYTRYYERIGGAGIGLILPRVETLETGGYYFMAKIEVRIIKAGVFEIKYNSTVYKLKDGYTSYKDFEYNFRESTSFTELYYAKSGTYKPTVLPNASIAKINSSTNYTPERLTSYYYNY